MTLHACPFQSRKYEKQIIVNIKNNNNKEADKFAKFNTCVFSEIWTPCTKSKNLVKDFDWRTTNFACVMSF